VDNAKHELGKIGNILLSLYNIYIETFVLFANIAANTAANTFSEIRLVPIVEYHCQIIKKRYNNRRKRKCSYILLYIL
jgi:hypothetical protein